ncbi:agmatine deiminase family protein [Shimazuella kribbensis]|uniref:agmatine deiminase family protein n=1 Tax=Shimazuella kribbensis TaxID=139808 RepID=UPI0004237EDA|nr:agmatine deiminase family protein [Shimazuella kribbensis]
MNKVIVLCLGAVLTLLGCSQSKGDEDTGAKKQIVGKYTIPDEKSKHEGSWLQWPHEYAYGKKYKQEIEPIWIEMASSLSEGEKVHIIAYDENEKNYIYDLLYDEGINMDKIDFYIVPTDDVWARDSAPIFVYDKDKNIKMMDWGFNGWGKKTPYKKDAFIPSVLSKQLGIERIDLNDVVLEGGAFELDGNGTFLSTRSAVVNKNRNPNLSVAKIEEYIKENLGVTNFIWLDGVPNLDITDFHIDGFAKFYDKSTIITMEKDDLVEWGASNKDIKTLMNAKNAFDKPYQYEYLPLSKNNVILNNGKNLGYKGSYINFYIGNTVVLVPNYNDPNDKIANDIIQQLYPDRKVIGIDVRELYKNGGMIHCVTQQQPVTLN